MTNTRPHIGHSSLFKSFTAKRRTHSMHTPTWTGPLARACLLLALLLSFVGHVPAARAASFTVTTLDDSGLGSLRAAMEQANATSEADTITFGVNGVITLASTLPTITGELSIDGPGADNLTISGNNAVRVLEVAAVGTLDLEGVAVANGYIFFEDGGGIYNLGVLRVTNSAFSGNYARQGGGVYNTGTLRVTNSAFSGNSARFGGGIYSSSEGTVTVQDTTFSGNSADNSGGGIDTSDSIMTIVNSTFTGNTTGDRGLGGGISINGGTTTVFNSTFSNNSARQGGGVYHRYGTMTVENSTISGNTAISQGGGIDNNINGTITVTNSTISGNSATTGGGIHNNDDETATLQNTIVANNPTGGNCMGPITDNGGNLSSDNSCAFAAASSQNSINPQLGPLQDNGGPTQTQALLPGSPAIDAAVNCPPPAADQRGVARPQDGNNDGVATCDSGAYEREYRYQFRGFFQPIDNLPTLNVVNAGRAIPVKFSLGGNHGLNIFAAGYPKSQHISCSSGTATDEVEQTVTAGASSLQYDAASDTYTYVWKTEKGWAGQCRQLIVRFVDGSEYTANFRFK
jgi:predicted outer membrane repeat protein